MAVRYTEEQLNTVDKSLLIQMFLNQQEQLETLTAEVRSLNEKMQLMMEQMVLANRNRFGRSSEKMEDASQISFMEVDGTIVFFNEAEAVCNMDALEPEQLEVPTPRPVKKKGKKEQDMLGLPIERIDHYMTEEELTAEFGKNGWKQLPDAFFRDLCYGWLSGLSHSGKGEGRPDDRRLLGAWTPEVRGSPCHHTYRREKGIRYLAGNETDPGDLPGRR